MKWSGLVQGRSFKAVLLGLLALAVLLLLPCATRGDDAPLAELEGSAGPPSEVVAEAHFLYDPLPPSGRDLGLSVVMVPDAPDPRTGGASLQVLPRLQFALALGERAGLTVDAALGGAGEPIQAPAASLKVLLRAPGSGRTGLSASLDLFGSTHSLAETEAGLGLGVIRQLGTVGLRASVALATGVTAWSPHLHAGVSAAMELAPGWRGLVEVIAEVGSRGLAVAAGPTLKFELSPGRALVAGALFPLDRGGQPPSFALQVVQSI